MSAPARQPEVLPLQTRIATIASVDVEARTIEVVWTTGATVRRSRYNGWDASIPFDEELVVSDEAIDLSRLNAGAPVVDSHHLYSIEAQRAVVERAWLVGGKGLAVLRFPEEGTDEASDRLFQLARQKIIRNISCGYSIDVMRVVPPEKAGEVERRIIERWTPYELSFVTVPADPGAQTRAADVRSYPLDIVGRAIGAAARTLDAARARMTMRARASGL